MDKEREEWEREREEVVMCSFSELLRRWKKYKDEQSVCQLLVWIGERVYFFWGEKGLKITMNMSFFLSLRHSSRASNKGFPNEP